MTAVPASRPGSAIVGVSRDFLGTDGRNVWGDIQLGLLEEAGVPWRYLDRDVAVLAPQDVAGFTAVLFARPAVTAATFAGLDAPPRLFARFGVGYDAVDLAACTAHGALVTITPDGARRPVSTAALTMILAALQHVAVKDRIVRSGDWSSRTRWMGRGLTGLTVGLLGLGNTATDLLKLLAPFCCRVLAVDPGRTAEQAAALGVELVEPAALFARSDVVVVMATLTPDTHRLVDAAMMASMPEGAVLVNVARGPIVDEAALVEGLRRGRPAVAALDVFEVEPLPGDSPLLGLDNVLLSPHSLAWTDEMSRGNGGSAVRAILDLLAGRTPQYVVNRGVLDRADVRSVLPSR